MILEWLEGKIVEWAKWRRLLRKGKLLAWETRKDFEEFKSCPECSLDIPPQARRCPFCTTQLIG